MTTPLAVFDLDGTLLRSDSFRRLILARLAARPALLSALGLRSLKVMGRSTFAEAAHKALAADLSDAAFLEAFAASLEADLDPDVIEKARRWRDAGARTVIVSASPHEYVVAVAQRLSFAEGHGSQWREGRYEHLYGPAKLSFLDRQFPAASYARRYAIADGASDQTLLDAFEQWELVKR